MNQRNQDRIAFAAAAGIRYRPAFFRLVSILFFLSGAAGLAYQIIWFKRFSHLWGNSTLAMAAVVASFLAGLGLGAYLLGMLADRVRAPLWWYGVLEAGVGILALLVPFEIGLLTPFYESLYQYLGGPLSLSAAKLVLTFLLLGPPCVLMGGTLPLMLRYFTPPGVALREFSGWLYGSNTLGAATGCYLTGFHLLPLLGLHQLNISLVVLNLAIGATAVAAARRPGRSDRPAAHTSSNQIVPAEEPDSVELPALYLVTAMTGCAALILEVVWTRQLALILGGSVYAFTAMLFPVLVGIGLGSLVFHWALAPLRRLERFAPLVILGLILSAAMGKWMISPLTAAVGLLKPLRALEAYNGLICVGASGVLEFLPSVGMGILFPLFVHLTRKRARDAGRAIGVIYGLNITGSILGSAGASLLLIPRLGLSLSVVVGLLLYSGALVLLFPTSQGVAPMVGPVRLLPSRLFRLYLLRGRRGSACDEPGNVPLRLLFGARKGQHRNRVLPGGSRRQCPGHAPGRNSLPSHQRQGGGQQHHRHDHATGSGLCPPDAAARV